MGNPTEDRRRRRLAEAETILASTVEKLHQQYGLTAFEVAGILSVTLTRLCIARVDEEAKLRLRAALRGGPQA